MKYVIIFLGIVALVLALDMLLAYPVMWLWNAVIPSLFGLKEIVWREAFFLLLLCSFLFKGYSSSYRSKD